MGELRPARSIVMDGWTRASHPTYSRGARRIRPLLRMATLGALSNTPQEPTDYTWSWPYSAPATLDIPAQGKGRLAGGEWAGGTFRFFTTRPRLGGARFKLADRSPRLPIRTNINESSQVTPLRSRLLLFFLPPARPIYPRPIPGLQTIASKFDRIPELPPRQLHFAP